METHFRILLLMSLSFAQEILQYPENRTVYLEQAALFTCVVTGGEVHGWRINGTSPTNLPPEDIKYTSDPEGGTTHLTLELLARAEYNGTKIQCLTANIGGGSDFSENVTLLIQGPLSAVGDLTASYSSSSVTVNWTAPFSLDVTGVDHDIWYSVIIYNVTDENNPTVMDCTDCINITDTHYTFTPNSPGLCQSFNFSIIPINGAGQGVSSHNVTGYSFDTSLFGSKPHLQAITDAECQATFKVGHIANGCHITMIPATQHPETNCSSNVCVLQSNKYYTFNITISNDAGGVVTSSVYFITFDVQNVVTNSGGNNFMTVEFMENTRSKGCFIVLQQCHEGHPDDFRVFHRPGNILTVTTMLTNLTLPNYILFVHDLEGNGELQEHAALKKEDATVSGNEQLSDSPSSILSHATINITGSSVIISCYFKSGVSKEASCVLVYRQCNSNTIAVKEYHKMNTSFPTSFDIDDPQLYTFAIFGKNGTSYDVVPLITKRIPETTSSTTTTTTTTTTSSSSATTSSSTPQTVVPSSDTIGKAQVAIISITTGLLVMVSCISIVILLAVQVKLKTKKGDGGMSAGNRAVEYEEVDLPKTTTSFSVIKTTPNTAYATTRFTVIDTQPNTAYSTTTMN